MLGEFQTLVNPGEPIPPFIAVLTGITDAMVAAAPRIEAVLPAFLEFAARRGAGRAQRAVRPRLPPGRVRRARARRGRRAASSTPRGWRAASLTRDEAPDCRLSTLARAVPGQHDAEPPRAGRRPGDGRRAARADRAARQPRRAVAGGAATFTVAGSARRSAASATSPSGCRTRPASTCSGTAAAACCTSASRKDIRARVRQLLHRVGAAHPDGRDGRLRRARSTPSCARTALEAEVRELRLIAEHKPRYNRRSRFPERAIWVKLTSRRFPRLSLVRQVRDDGAAYLGPFGSARSGRAGDDGGARGVPAAPVHQAAVARATVARRACCAEMGRCGAPCERPSETGTRTAGTWRRSRRRWPPTPSRSVGRCSAGSTRWPRDGGTRTPRAPRPPRGVRPRGRARDAAARGAGARSRARRRAAGRPRRLGALGGAPRTAGRGRRGAAVGVDPRPHVDALVATAETVLAPAPGPLPCATARGDASASCAGSSTPGTRLVRVDGEWASPASGAARLLRLFEETYEPAGAFADRRSMRTVERPARTRMFA